MGPHWAVALIGAIDQILLNKSKPKRSQSDRSDCATQLVGYLRVCTVISDYVGRKAEPAFTIA